MRKEEIRAYLCKCLWRMSHLPALSSDDIPARLKDYWGTDIDEVSTPEVYARVKKLEENMDGLLQLHEEEYPDDRPPYGWEKPSNEKVIKALKGDEDGGN